MAGLGPAPYPLVSPLLPPSADELTCFDSVCIRRRQRARSEHTADIASSPGYEAANIEVRASRLLMIYRESADSENSDSSPHTQKKETLNYVALTTL